MEKLCYIKKPIYKKDKIELFQYDNKKNIMTYYKYEKKNKKK